MTTLSRSSYSEQQRDEAMLAYYTLGTFKKAATETGIPSDTIKHWVLYTQKEHYQALIRRHGPELEQQLVGRLQHVAARATEVAAESLDATSDAVAQGDYKAAQAFSNTAKNATLSAGITVDKSQLIQGKPTSIVANDRDAEDILRSLNNLIPGLVIDSTATEIPTTQIQQTTPHDTPELAASRPDSTANARAEAPADTSSGPPR